jgi:pimeloyl-ACP methyl ester carboxylesterase
LRRSDSMINQRRVGKTLLFAVGTLVGCTSVDKAPASSVNAQLSCAALQGKTLAGANIVSAQATVASGELPALCKIVGHIAPSLNFELHLPDQWNGKLTYVGGGGYNGAIPPLGGMSLSALNMGYAVVSSDSGHQASGVDASWALHDPHAAQLFGSLSVPTVMSSTIELLVEAYGSRPALSYFEGCSNGGREGLMSAQRYPNLFDGIIARAPAYNWVGFMGAFNRTAKAVAAPGGQFSAAKLNTLPGAVRNACDAQDGITDGLVSNPAACNFDPSVLRCPAGADTGDTCLSDAQLAVVESWTTPAVFAGSPTYRNAGWYLTGAEADPGAWPVWVTGGGNVNMAAQFLFQSTTVKTYLARDLSVDSLTYIPYDQNAAALYGMEALNDATSTDLRPLRDSNAKLILWHGGNDAALSTKSTTAYYDGLVTTMGGQAQVDAFVRYYVAPGVNHCAGGPGADSTDLLTALDRWVQEGAAPETLTAEKVESGAVSFSRPLCRHPQYPHYTGPANNADAARLAANYSCRAP